MSSRDMFSTAPSPSSSGHNVMYGVGRGQSVLSCGYGRGRPVCPVEVTHDHVTDESVLCMSGPPASSTPIAHTPHPIPQTSPQVVTTDTLGSIITDLAKQISDNIAASFQTVYQPSSPQPQSPSSQNVSVDPRQFTVVVQPESRPPPLFRGDQSEPFSIHEWEDMMKSYINRAACSSDSDRSELIMSRLAGRARDVVKVSLRSCPMVSPAELPTTVFDILRRNFSELTFSSMPMKDFYGTMPRHSENAMDYWIRLNKAIDVADEYLRKRGKGVEDPRAEVVMMFISHCPDPSLAVSFQFKPVELWTAAEVQERLDSHVRSLRCAAAHTKHAVNISTCAHESTVPAPHCGMQHQPPVVVTPPLVPPMPATACAPVPSQPQQPSVPAAPAVDAKVHEVVALFDQMLSLCTASLANAGRAPRQSQSYSRQPQGYSRQPQSYFRQQSSHRPGGHFEVRQHTRVQADSLCTVCGDSSHTTFAHCKLYGLCLSCHKPGHFRNECPLPPEPPVTPARSDAALN